MSHLSGLILFYTRHNFFDEADVETTLKIITPYFETEKEARVSLEVALDRYIVDVLHWKLPSSPYLVSEFKQYLHQILDSIKGEQEKANAIARMGGADGAGAIVALLDLKKL